MARTRVVGFYFFLLSLSVVSSRGVTSQKDGKYDDLKSKDLGMLHFSSRELLQFFFLKETETMHDKIEPPVIHPSPPSIPAPPVDNIPPPNPSITVTPNRSAVPGANPSTTPVPVPSTNITNSSSPPLTPSTIPVAQPLVPPPAIANVPHNPVQRWCVAKSGAPQAALQAALDYACGVGGVDCTVVQQGGSCYNPVTLENHASYAFNSFYQRNPVATSCDFGGTAMVTSTNPSSGSCIFPTSSSTSTSSVPPPVMQTPIQTPPTPSAVPSPPAGPTPPVYPAAPAFPTPPAGPTPPVYPAAPAFPTPPASPTPHASPTPPTSPTLPTSPTPPLSSSGTPIPRVTGSPVSANSTNNTKSGVPMGGFPNIFPTVSTSMPPANAPSATSNSKPSTLAEPFKQGFIMVTLIVTWKHILNP